ncbi:MAG: hypothetical protein QOH58_16 [Thermoleophilaceae bacterium]|jgi:uncharacterized protein GlcG (DUF336 family)|nr:hypothetical protein [Thermoleophilaceae bacterium]
MPLPLDSVQRLIEASLAHARGLDLQITVAVVDESGILQALSRMDGAPPLSAQIAEAKASASALWHRDGDQIASVQQNRPEFLASLAPMTRLPIVPVDGSVVLRQAGTVVGAVGVSGATGAQDRECADAGRAALASA